MDRVLVVDVDFAGHFDGCLVTAWVSMGLSGWRSQSSGF